MKTSEYKRDLISKLNLIPKWTKIGIIGVIFMYLGLAGLTSAALPWWIGKGDSALHIDYALSVYHHEIPNYRDYVKYPIFHQLDKDYKTQIQRAAANPPLFYILHAPIVGPLLDAGRWKPAIALGRAFNVFLGVLAVLSLAWAGWLFGGKRKELIAVAVPAVGAACFHFTNLNQNYALDVLLILLGVLTFIVWFKLIKHGFKKRYIISLFVLSILGMSTKATYIVFLGISLLAVLITAYLHNKGTRTKKLFNGSMIAGAILMSVMIAIGWFYYYWNYKTSGKWYTGELPGDFGSRAVKSFANVMTNHGLWGNFYEMYSSSENLSKLLMFASSVGVVIAIARTKLKELRKDKALLISTALLVLLLLGTTATQITHAVGIGHFSFRYFLPALLVFSLFISYGLLEIRQLRGQLLSLALVAMVITSVITTAKLDNIKSWVPAVGMTNNIYQKFDLAFANNGLPEILIVLLLAFVCIGTITTAVSLFVLTKPAVKTRS